MDAANLSKRREQPDPRGGLDSALHKSQSAAEALVRQAQTASRAMAQQQHEFNKRQAAINAGGSTEQVGKGGQQMTRRRAKKQAWWEKSFRKRGDRKGSGGKGS